MTMWGRLETCRPIVNRPPWDEAKAARGRLTIGLQDAILPHIVL